MNPTATPDSNGPMPQPLVAFLEQFVTDSKLASFDSRLALRTRHFTVALEDLYAPHNTSACLRSCDGFGLQDVHVIEKQHHYRVSPNVARGSAQRLTLARYSEGENSSADCVTALRKAGYRIIATSPRDDAVPLEDIDVTEKSALFFGREKPGLSDFVLNEADELLRIPMYGFAESFNISVAVAICLHHLTWKLRASDVDWQLSEAERAVLRSDWLRKAIGYRLPKLEREYRRRQ